MLHRSAAARTWFAAAVLPVCIAAASMAAVTSESLAADNANQYPKRGKVAAILTALFHHDAYTNTAGDSFEETHREAFERRAFVSASPEKTLSLRERSKVIEFAKSLVYEGGYYPKEIYALLGYTNVATARTARLFRQLDVKMGDPSAIGQPSPWEVAGRVGRSGMQGSSDHWAMAPGNVGEAPVSSPGTLAYLPALAVVYAAYPEDGIEAAAQLAILKDDDMRAASVARAGMGLLIRVMTGEKHDKDAWLRLAAKDAKDADTEHDLRAIRVKDWRYLRGEECAMGRLERAAFIWYRGGEYKTIMTQGNDLLRSRESLAYLAALTAATYGQESLPAQVVTNAASDRQLFELINDLYDLATSEAVLPVTNESDIE